MSAIANAPRKSGLLALTDTGDGSRSMLEEELFAGFDRETIQLRPQLRRVGGPPPGGAPRPSTIKQFDIFSLQSGWSLAPVHAKGYWR